MQSSASEIRTCVALPAQTDRLNAYSMSGEAAILDVLDLPILTVGHDCKVVQFNQAATEALGLRLTDIGRLPSNIQLLNDLKEIEKLSAQVMADGETCKCEIRSGDRYFLVRIAPYRGRNGQIEGAVLSFTNITAFRASIAQAIYDREYTKTILNTVAQPLVVVDAELGVQTANRAFYEMFGVSREATRGTPLCKLGNHDWSSLTVWAALKASIFDNREFKTLEVEGDFPTIGRRMLLFDACRLARNGDALVLVGLRDITDRKLAEKELKRSQEELKDFIENASVGMHWGGPDGTVLWANRTELRMLGYTAEEYIGHNIAEFHADQPMIENILKRLSNHETVQECEARLRCKDGSIRDVMINSNVLWEGDKFVHTRCFTRDVTERKRTEAALNESEERYRTLFDSMDEGFCIIDLIFDENQKPVDYSLLEINPAFAKQTGIEDAKGKLMRELVPGYEQHWFDIYGKIALTGEPARFENRAAALNRWYEVYAFRVAPPEARRVGIVFNDITERKRQEEKLERTVAERTASLREIVGELEAFSYSVAHDMRAPLRGMQGFAKALSVDYASQLDARASDYLRRITSCSRRLDRLIQDVLNYSKIVKTQVVVEPLDLDGLTRDVIGTYPDWQPPKAEIQIESDLPKVLGNEAFLTQCISNLVSNAVKFVSPGTVPRVRIWAEEVALPDRYENSQPNSTQVSRSSEVRVYVADNGIGIAQDNHARIFRMFERIYPATEYEGTGIGLTIARRAAERMGGSIGFESELGKGSKFWIQLKVC
jgi:PAS domain S-box-containing protein